MPSEEAETYTRRHNWAGGLLVNRTTHCRGDSVGFDEKDEEVKSPFLLSQEVDSL